MKLYLRAAWWLLALLCGAATAQEQSSALDTEEALRVSRAAIGRQIGDHVLLDRQERPVRLASYRGKPLLVSFIYTGCFQVCPTSTRALQESVRELQRRLGPDRFNVVSIGFNQPADSPQAMKAFSAQHRIDAPNWEFLSPAAPVAEALARDFGFRYLATPAGFEHVLQVTLVDGAGRIVRQVYGDRAASDELYGAMSQLLGGAAVPPPSALEDLIDQVRILCSVYDPQTGTYRTDYKLFLEIAGGATFLLVMVFFFVNEWRENRALRRRKTGRV